MQNTNTPQDIQLHVAGLTDFMASNSLSLMAAWSIYFQSETNTEIATAVLAKMA